jgi:type III secretion system YopN/LcrE/InvE/MxiC family regulator
MSITTPREIQNSQIATHNVTSTVGAEVMANAQGRMHGTGEAVTVSSHNSDMTEALEEIGMLKSHLGKSDLSKLKVRKGAGSDLDSLSRIADFYDKLPNLPTDQKSLDLIMKLQTYDDSFKEGGKGGGSLPTAEDIRNLLREYDGDITHQFAALEDARMRFEAAGASPAFLSVLDEVRAEMRNPDSAQEIKAGFASAKEAVGTADRFASKPEDFRDSYRQMLRSGGNLGRIFDSLGDFANSGVKGDKAAFDVILDSFLRVAGDDMKSFGSSTDKAILGDVIAELKVLKNLRTVMEMSVGMLDKLGRMFPDQATELPPAVGLVSQLLHFTASSARRDAEKIVAAFDGKAPEVPVVAVNLLRDIHAQIPDSAMPTDTARLQQDKILKMISDKLVATEEAQYGG